MTRTDRRRLWRVFAALGVIHLALCWLFTGRVTVMDFAIYAAACWLAWRFAK